MAAFAVFMVMYSDSDQCMDGSGVTFTLTGLYRGEQDAAAIVDECNDSEMGEYYIYKYEKKFAVSLQDHPDDVIVLEDGQQYALGKWTQPIEKRTPDLFQGLH